MIEYIYFVKCPNCEDEHFDFFDEAKEYAMGCLSKNPIITQVEVCRNDFGECTDSKDLGTIWSSDYVIADVDKAPSDTPSVLTKDFLNKVGTEEDPEFAALDNSVDVEEPVGETSEISAIDEVPDNFRKPLTEGNFGVYFKKKEDWNEFKRICDEIGIKTMGDVESFMRHEGATPNNLLDKLREYRAELGPDFKIKESRKPVPEDMTIEQLVETMEENEDEVECTWCNELYPKDECRYEVNLGYLCSRCEAAIKSRGETLTFRENNYWDFLDEEVEPVKEPETRYWICWYDGNDVGVIEASSEGKAEDQFIDSYSDSLFFDSWDHDWSVEEISKEEYDEYLNESLKEDMTLTEGPYDYEHIAALADTKQQILDQLMTDARFTKCFRDGKLHVTYYRRAPGSYSGFSHTETITDFEFNSEGRMIITLTTFLRDVSRVRKADLETVLAGTTRSMISYTFLKELRDIARDLNRRHKPSVSARRDTNVFETLNNNPAVAEELKNYIKKIEYRIPLLETYPEEFQVDKAGEPLTEKAVKKLEEIYSNFMRLPYADAAIDAGLVKNRPASEDANHNIENSWACVGNITFDCPISDLSQEAQKVIAGAKLKTDVDLKTDTYTTSCYRLINALAKYYGDDIFFYENKSKILVASLNTKELAEQVNEEHPAVESTQELKGTDNAVVDCKVAKVVTHSEDEKPVDCEGKKKPLEKPLTEVTKITKDELIAKEGTDDVDLINAGREPEDRVELAEDYGMIDCPECGAKKTFDPETGVCNNCGHLE